MPRSRSRIPRVRKRKCSAENPRFTRGNPRRYKICLPELRNSGQPLKAEPGSDDGAKRGRSVRLRRAVVGGAGRFRRGQCSSLFPAGFSEAVSREESAAGGGLEQAVVGQRWHFRTARQWLLSGVRAQGGLPGAGTVAGGAAGFRGGWGRQSLSELRVRSLLRGKPGGDCQQLQAPEGAVSRRISACRAKSSAAAAQPRPS